SLTCCWRLSISERLCMSFLYGGTNKLTITSQMAMTSKTSRIRFSRCQTVAARRARKSAYPCSTSADCSAVHSFVTKFFCDPQQLVVLGHAVTPTGCTGLDLTGVGRHRDVSNGRILGFPRAMTDHSGVMVLLCQIDRRKCLRQRADLIDLDQNGIRHVFGYSSSEKFHIRDKKIVADQLNFCAEFIRQFLPALPIILGATVLDRNDRKPRAKLGVVIDQFFSGFFCTTGFFENVNVLFAVIEFRRSRIECDKDLFAQLVTGLLDSCRNRLKGVFGGI